MLRRVGVFGKAGIQWVVEEARRLGVRKRMMMIDYLTVTFEEQLVVLKNSISKT